MFWLVNMHASVGARPMQLLPLSVLWKLQRSVRFSNLPPSRSRSKTKKRDFLPFLKGSKFVSFPSGISCATDVYKHYGSKEISSSCLSFLCKLSLNRYFPILDSCDGFLFVFVHSSFVSAPLKTNMIFFFFLSGL